MELPPRNSGINIFNITSPDIYINLSAKCGYFSGSELSI
jgi:hypothetical protein